MGRRGGGMRGGGARRRSPSPSGAAPKRNSSSTAKKQAPSSSSSTNRMGGASTARPTMSGGPSFLGTLAASMAGSAAGHVLARGLMNAFEGNASPEEIREVKEATRSIEVPDECQFQAESFKRCVESQGNDNLSACKWAWDMLGECSTRASAAMQPPATQKEWI